MRCFEQCKVGVLVFLGSSEADGDQSGKMKNWCMKEAPFGLLLFLLSLLYLPLVRCWLVI